MSNFNAKEILEVAVVNEKNGANFYMKLAGRVENVELKKTLNEFVQHKNEHISTIKGLINSYLEKGDKLSYYDDPEELLYLQAIANSTLFADKPHTVNLAEVLCDTLCALKYAVDVEIKSIEFFKQVLQVMGSGSGKEEIETIIEHEKGLVTSLYKMIKNK